MQAREGAVSSTTTPPSTQDHCSHRDLAHSINVMFMQYHAHLERSYEHLHASRYLGERAVTSTTTLMSAQESMIIAATAASRIHIARHVNAHTSITNAHGLA